MKPNASMPSLGTASDIDGPIVKQRPSEDIPSIKGMALEKNAEGQCAAMDLPLPSNNLGFSETSYFLQECFLCKRRLMPDQDIYMYR